MRIDERLRTDLAAAAEAVAPASDALDAARQLGRRRKRGRQAVVGAAMAGVVVLGGLLAWSEFGDDPEQGGVVVTDQPTPVPTVSPDQTPDAAAAPEPTEGPDPLIQARIASAPISNRVNPVAVWTGEEVVIWGGIEGGTPLTADVGSGGGSVYVPRTDTWRTIAIGDAGPRDPAAVWDGTNLLTWGGTGYCRGFDGAIFGCEPYLGWVSVLNPQRGTSTVGSSAPMEARQRAEALWTGNRMIVWGGFRGGVFDAPGFADGGIYDPGANTWTSIPDNPFRQGGRAITAFHDNSLIVGTGQGWGVGQVPGWSRYQLDTGEWTQIPDSPVTIEPFAAGVQVGDKVVVFNGDVGNPLVKGSGAILDLNTDTWVELAGPPDHPDTVDGVAIGHRAVFLAPETGRLLVYDLDQKNWSTTWDHGDDTLVGARTLVQAGETSVMAWNESTGEGVIVDIAALVVIAND